MFNHSCEPSLVRASWGSRLVLAAGREVDLSSSLHEECRYQILFFPKGGGGGGVDGHVHRPLDRVHVAGEEGVLGTGLSLPLQMPRMLVSKWIISYIMYYHKMTTLMAVQFIIANPLLSNGWEPPEDSNEDSWSSELSERSPNLHLISF